MKWVKGEEWINEIMEEVRFNLKLKINLIESIFC